MKISKCISFFCWSILLFCSPSFAAGSFHLFIKEINYPDSLQPRNIYVYLPSGYEKSTKRYPVIYMHDGQNLFDESRSSTGQTWDALNTLNNLIDSKEIEPLIVVAIDNTADRKDDYIPELKGKQYLDFIVNRVKPLVDNNLRTKQGPENTGIVGSSLGGLISLSAGLEYPNIFGRVGALSPSIWWNDKSILNAYRNKTILPISIYLDSGTVGGEEPENVLELADILLDRGFQYDKNLGVYIQEGADHQEYYWASRLPIALKSLFPYSH